jgi:hypothetical protein
LRLGADALSLPAMPLAHRRALAGLALLLAPLTGGCIAAVAIPLVAGGALSARSHAVHVRAATRARAAAAAPASPTSRPAATQATLTTLTELPPPSGSLAGAVADRWRPFFDYAMAAGQAKDGLQSALLANPANIDTALRRPCTSKHVAVVIDLDQGPEPFAPEHIAPAPASVAQGLASLRQANVTVLWIARLPGGRADNVAAALKASGLDPEGADQLLLLRTADDRKQVLRQQAQDDVCVVAIAGDERGDFDELFDYLRNPAGAPALYPLMGNGWFLVPPLAADQTGQTSAISGTPSATTSSDSGSPSRQ